ncbi:MAG: GGDEF domain-containing protein [Candidatus Marinimicrobia bacterium]|nr:GGDEF domain-containing protein [Candidatus Neomarinimicrobiota bacterium]MBT4827214.1 GGDEF domain-containing protein [Candidatus Neomarinimicrobiota bacterium]MBT5225636.1 GGDEF domain-containing protein [Candidatus Neomarinimicrobiota bacterium]
MSTINNLPTFTKALAAFCLVLFIFLFLPESLSNYSEILRYLILLGIIVILMIYSQLLGSLTSSPAQAAEAADTDESTTYQTDLKTTDHLYGNLKKLVLSTVKAINPKFDSAIYMIDPEAGVFSLQASHTDDFLDSIPSNNSIISSMLKDTSTVYQKDDKDGWNELFDDKPWRGSECIIGSPISLHESIAGFVLTRIDHFSDMTDKDKSVLQTMGKFISHGLGSLESLEKHIMGDENKSRIIEILSELNFKSDESQVLDHFKYLIRTFFYYDRLTVSLKSEKDFNSIIKLVDGVIDEFVEGTEFPSHGTLHGLPIASEKVVLSQNWKESYENVARFNSNEAPTDFQSVLGVPIIANGESRGSLFIERITGQPYTTADEQNLTLIGRVMGASLNWLMEYEKIYQNATHDGLSKLLNHQTYKERFSEEIQRAKRFQHHMAVLMFDLDKFKRVNDTLGHPYGDYVIQTVAKIMSENVRTVDVVARYGGEEFAIILINTTPEMALVVSQRIVDNIADYPYSMNDETIHMTISGGMSLYPTHSENMKDLIGLADKAMYDAKQVGGNQIKIHSNDDATIAPT